MGIRTVIQQDYMTSLQPCFALALARMRVVRVHHSIMTE